MTTAARFRGAEFVARTDADLRRLMRRVLSNWPVNPWPDSYYDPIVGCDIIDRGCARCYAADRIGRASRKHPAIKSQPDGRASYNGRLFRAPRAAWFSLGSFLRREIVFAFSMTDFFHSHVSPVDRLTFRQIVRRHPHKLFNVLTKRTDEMAAWFSALGARYGYVDQWPNVRWGISACDQKTLDRRWPTFRDVPTALRHLSLQPLLGPIELPPDVTAESVAWVVVMREVGKRPRPMRAEWVKSLRQQCDARGIPFFWELTTYENADSPHADNDAVLELRRATSTGRPYAVSPMHLRALHDANFARLGSDTPSRY